METMVENKRVVAPGHKPPISRSKQLHSFNDQRPETLQLQAQQQMMNESSSDSSTSYLNDDGFFKDHRPISSVMKNSFSFKDNRAEAVQFASMQKMANDFSLSKNVLQRKENNTGLPDTLKSGIESLSGYAMDDVRVHYNSDKPAQLNAYAYAQGSEIHMAPGQEKHLPHEAWHVVQQKQGRVQPTAQLKSGVSINADIHLEKEADTMGEKAIQCKQEEGKESLSLEHRTSPENKLPIQRKIMIDGASFPVGDDERAVSLSNREFRKNLMLQLKNNDFKELGTKAMWRHVNNMLDDEIVDEGRVFADWETFINGLWDQGLLTRKLTGSSMGPKNMGGRPQFTPDVTNELELGAGQHRRHIIASSTLGKGIEMAYEQLKELDEVDVLAILNNWLQGIGGVPQTSEYKALREIWKMVHNHMGNLWVGDGMWNSAIGFIRTPLTALLGKIKGARVIETAVLMEQVARIKPTFKMLESAWLEISKTLQEAIYMANPVHTETSFLAAFIHWKEEVLLIDETLENPLNDMHTEMVRSCFQELGVTNLKLKLRLPGFIAEFPQLEEYTTIIIKWLDQMAYSNKYIEEETANTLIMDWIANCDLDFPFGEVVGEREAYFMQLKQIYEAVIVPGPELFAADGALTAFMLLSYGAE